MPWFRQGWVVLRAECREIEADRSQLVASLRQSLAGQEVHPGAVTKCAQQLRINMQDEVSSTQARIRARTSADSSADGTRTCLN